MACGRTWGLPRVYVLRFTFYALPVSKKSIKIAALIERCKGGDLDAHYLGYFECFNSGKFYEAHDVLEELWLAQRRGPNDAFYKGLIQLAGAFVHLQKHTIARPRLRPAAALFRLARANLQAFAPVHERLDVAGTLGLIDEWLTQLDSGVPGVNPLSACSPKLFPLPGK
jgi:predicted metal-dependent hydrolase